MLVGIFIHKRTMTSFAITLYGQCCRLHAVGQQVVSAVPMVVKVFVAGVFLLTRRSARSRLGP